MRITAKVEKNPIKLPGGAHLPDGPQVRIKPIAAGARHLAERHASLNGNADDLPADLAKNLDYHIHGHPKICA